MCLSIGNEGDSVSCGMATHKKCKDFGGRGGFVGFLSRKGSVGIYFVKHGLEILCGIVFDRGIRLSCARLRIKVYGVFVKKPIGKIRAPPVGFYSFISIEACCEKA